MIALLQEIEGLGCRVEVEGERLKLHNPSVLTDRYKQLLRNAKGQIIDLLSRQKRARQKGWIVYPFGQAFEKQVGRSSYVYLFAEHNDAYTVWRGTWRESNKPETEKVLVSGVDFETAFQRANEYVEWFGKRSFRK